MSDRIGIGTFVHLSLPECKRIDRTAYGRVEAIERYTDYHGSRTWLYVRWITSEGVPDENCKKHSAMELEVLESQEVA